MSDYVRTFYVLEERTARGYLTAYTVHDPAGKEVDRFPVSRGKAMARRDAHMHADFLSWQAAQVDEGSG